MPHRAGELVGAAETWGLRVRRLVLHSPTEEDVDDRERGGEGLEDGECWLALLGDVGPSGVELGGFDDVLECSDVSSVSESALFG